ncbi:hypothetical protein MPSI1_002949 [Malassezia psittaci]|uniref:Pseudouridine synthase RsuA/RluA-like domain-containing protein n=1 Tax=Malassezia psittaci TaxID=1821823 RepID=A0AAF0F7U7_9BASI|nr:hypothetical protein MPSI1_002949 [Malassezia psittaci]
MVKEQTGLEQLYPSNRLDRLTSGIMVFSTTKDAARDLGNDFNAGLVNKAYVCRVVGQFPETLLDCQEPILAVDRQSGLNIIHPKGKSCRTLFQRLFYDPDSDSSVVLCRPITGRTHQIRVHAQFLGHPITNDPLYNHPVWASVDNNVLATAQPRHYERVGGETGNLEVERVLAALKGARDDSEGWARWRDDVLFGTINREMQYESIDVPGPNGQPASPPPVDVAPMTSEICEVCRVPLLSDPAPEELYIYLHAIKYWTDTWSFQDELPWWALPSKEGNQRQLPDIPLLTHHQGVDVGKGGAYRRVEEPKETPITLIERPVVQVKRGSSDTPAIVLAVTRGLEDVLQYDLLHRLSSADEPVRIESALHSGVVCVDASQSAGEIIALSHNASLPTVLDVYYDMGRHILPQDLMDDLFTERLAFLGAGGSHKNDVPSTAQEQRFLVWIQEAWNSHSDQREHVLKAFFALSPEVQPSFSVTVDRSSYVFPTLSTSALESQVEQLVSRWLASATSQEWLYQKRNASVAVRMFIAPRFAVQESLESGPRARQGNPRGSVIFGLRTSAQQDDSADVIRKTMAYSRASAVVGLLPLPEQDPVHSLRLSTLRSKDGALQAALIDQLSARNIASDYVHQPVSGSLDGAIVELPEKQRGIPHAALFPLTVEWISEVNDLMEPYAHAILLTSEPKLALRSLREVENESRRTSAPYTLQLVHFHWTTPNRIAHIATLQDSKKEVELRNGMRSISHHHTYLVLVRKVALYRS